MALGAAQDMAVADTAVVDKVPARMGLPEVAEDTAAQVEVVAEPLLPQVEAVVPLPLRVEVVLPPLRAPVHFRRNLPFLHP